MTSTSDVRAKRPVTPRSRALPFRPDVQGLRALAVVLVVAHHSAFSSGGGFVGVDVFFVVSGFVISRLLLRELDSTGGIIFRSFYARRVKRLLPALCVVLLAVAGLSLLVMTPLGGLQTAAQTGIGASLFSANAVLLVVSGGYFDTAAESNPLLHLWTLAVEEQFYFVFPALLVVSWRVAGRRRARPRVVAAWTVALVALASLALCTWLTLAPSLGLAAPPRSAALAFYSSPTRAWEFALGALVALAEVRLAVRLPRHLSFVAALTGLLGIGLAVSLFDSTTAFPGVAAALPAGGTALVIAAGTRSDNVVSRFLGARPITFLGDNSYSWYLWHWPLIVFARESGLVTSPEILLLIAMLGLPLAWLTGRYIENPIRRRPQIRGLRVARLAVVCCLVPVIAFSATLVFAKNPPNAVASLIADARPHLDETQRCMGNQPGTPSTAQCTWTVPNPTGSVLLLGDSNAGQFAEPILALARKRGWNFTLATFGGCPFAPVSTIYLDDPHDVEGCNAFVKAWSDEVVRERPTAVVLASATTGYLETPGVALASTGQLTGGTTEPAVKGSMWRAAVHQLVQRWSGAGVSTVVVNTIPRFIMFDLRRCPALVAYRGASGCASQQVTSKLAAAALPGHEAERLAVAGVPRTMTLDLTKDICPRAVCSTYRDGHFSYRDGTHLSVSMADALEPQFASALDSVLGRRR